MTSDKLISTPEPEVEPDADPYEKFLDQIHDHGIDHADLSNGLHACCRPLHGDGDHVVYFWRKVDDDDPGIFQLWSEFFDPADKATEVLDWVDWTQIESYAGPGIKALRASDLLIERFSLFCTVVEYYGPENIDPTPRHVSLDLLAYIITR